MVIVIPADEANEPRRPPPAVEALPEFPQLRPHEPSESTGRPEPEPDQPLHPDQAPPDPLRQAPLPSELVAPQERLPLDAPLRRRRRPPVVAARRLRRVSGRFCPEDRARQG